MFGKNAERIDTFNGKQLLEELDHEMTLTMTGGSLENAVGNLFQLMRKPIFQEISYPIIQMEAKEADAERIEYLKALSITLQAAIKDLKHDLGIV